MEFTFFQGEGKILSVQTQTGPHACTHASQGRKSPPSTPLFRKEDEGLREPGTIGVTFCPLLLGARGRSSASWAGVRHQAGCQAGREHSLTFVEVVLARKKKPPSPLAFPHRPVDCWGGGPSGQGVGGE